MNVVELFSGIGSQIRALNNVADRYGFRVNVVNTCEWEIHAIIAYDLIHNGTAILPEVELMSVDELRSILLPMNLSTDGKTPISPRTIASMNEPLLKALLSALKKTGSLVNISDVRGTDLKEDFDLLTYSFPCQDLSNVGAFHGYVKGIDRDAKTRSGLLWEVERILNERHDAGAALPRYLLLENVIALNSKRHRNNFDEWQQSLNRLGYHNKVFEMYAPLYGIPQNRKRLLMLSVHTGLSGTLHEETVGLLENWNFQKSKNFGYRNSKLEDYLRLDYSNNKYFTEALSAQPNNTKSRGKIWNENLKIVDADGKIPDKTSTLTTKQDRHPNSGNLFFDPVNEKSRFRFLTPRECFLLMGFKENDFEMLASSGLHLAKENEFFSRDKLYRLAGNSIVVNVLEAIFEIVAVLERDVFA